MARTGGCISSWTNRGFDSRVVVRREINTPIRIGRHLELDPSGRTVPASAQHQLDFCPWMGWAELHPPEIRLGLGGSDRWGEAVCVDLLN